MKVMLINPPLSREEQKNPVIANLFSNAMPLGMLFLASYCLSKGVDVQAIDGPAERIRVEHVMERLKKYGPDVVGITTTTPVFHRAIELATEIKKWRKDLPVVVGGPHVNAAPVQAMEHECFDVGCAGEGEEAFYELVETLGRGGSPSEVRGLVIRDGNGITFTPPRVKLADVDSLPFPARHLLNPRLYASLPTDVRFLPKFTALSTRGCPFKCTFCDHAAEGKKYRTPSPKYMADEVEHLVKDFKAREVAFVGTTFTARREQAMEFCEHLLRRNIKVAWTCSTRVDVVSEDLLKLMKRAGCWSIRFGIESGNDEILSFIKKGITKEQVRKALGICEDIGIHTKAFFIIGHPKETRETIEETIEFACSLPLTDVTVQINTPLPNTVQFAQAKKYGTIKEIDYSKYSFWDVVFVPHGLTREDLLFYHKEFYRRFFWRPITIKRQLAKVSHWATLWNYIRCLDLILYLTLDIFKRPAPVAAEAVAASGPDV
jgi:radical SAM superfamily enzyme YgiQ (UPF0313 family)